MKTTTIRPVSDELLLWKKFIGGDRQAFQELILSHYKPLLNYGMRFCRDQDFIEDVIQDLFIYLWEHKQDLTETPASVKNYLFKAFRNRMIFDLKQHQRLTDFSEKHEDLEDFLEGGIQDSWIHSESETHLNSHLASMVSQLPDRQREALFLKYYHDCDIQQIADIMGINRQSVSNHLQKAIHYLKSHVQKQQLFFNLLACLSVTLLDV